MLYKYGLILLVSAVVGALSGCSPAKPVENFEPIKAVGVWNFIEFKTPHDDEQSSRCTIGNLGVTPEGKLFAEMKGSNLDQNGTVTPDQANPGHLLVDWRNDIYDFVFSDTDYENYATVIGCKDGDDAANPSYIVFMSRTQSLDNDLLQKLRKKVSDIGIDLSKVATVERDGC